MIGEKKKIAHEVVLSALKLSVAVLKLSVTISSLNIITNADCYFKNESRIRRLSWLGKNKQQIDNTHKMFY